MDAVRSVGQDTAGEDRDRRGCRGGRGRGRRHHVLGIIGDGLYRVPSQSIESFMGKQPLLKPWYDWVDVLSFDYEPVCFARQNPIWRNRDAGCPLPIGSKVAVECVVSDDLTG